MILQAYDPSTNPLNNNEWSFPLLEVIHIVSFAVAVGTVALVDLRLLGVGMRQVTAARLQRVTLLWTGFGILSAVMSGIALWTTDPLEYLHNRAFQFKLICLAAAIVYNYTLHWKAALAPDPAVWGKLAGAVSLVLWLSVVFGGIFYAFL